MTKLTPKQEAFIGGIASGKTQSDAYRSAYDAENMTPKQIWEEASKLAASPKVSQRLFEMQQDAQERNLVTVESLTKELNKDRKLARKNGQSAAAVSAVMGKAKLHGLLSDNLNISNPDKSLSPTTIILAAEPLKNDNGKD